MVISMPSRIQGNLSSMPTEIIERIVHWVHHLPSINRKHQDRQPNASSDSEIALQKFQTINDTRPLNDIRSLASINRAYYQICRPYLYGGFDFQAYTVDRLKHTLEEIIQRHSNHVKRIWCRVPVSRTEEVEYSWNAEPDPNLDPLGHPKSRCELLLKILQSCPHLIKLVIDLNAEYFMQPSRRPWEISNSTNHRDASTSLVDDHHAPMLSYQPISQLNLLTHLSLSSPRAASSYTEVFLVDVISKLSQLQSFACSRINATRPNPLDDRKDQKACRSPLGLHLASLTHLVELDLEAAECLDASWNQLDWKSSLKGLALKYCHRVSLLVLHGLLQSFQSTLITLELENVPNDSECDNFQFELPNLINLTISSYGPTRFLRHFETSKNLSSISLGDTPSYKYVELKEFFQDQLWPNLKNFRITNQRTFLAWREIDEFQAFCQGYGIVMKCDAVGCEDYVWDDYYHPGEDSDLEPDYSEYL